MSSENTLSPRDGVKHTGNTRAWIFANHFADDEYCDQQPDQWKGNVENIEVLTSKTTGEDFLNSENPILKKHGNQTRDKSDANGHHKYEVLLFEHSGHVVFKTEENGFQHRNRDSLLRISEKE